MPAGGGVTSGVGAGVNVGVGETTRVADGGDGVWGAVGGKAIGAWVGNARSPPNAQAVNSKSKPMTSVGFMLRAIPHP